MALPSCRLSSAINYTLLSLQERCSLSRVAHTHTHIMRAHTADAEGQTPAECLSPLLLASATARHCGRDGHLLSARLDWKGARRARCIMLLFSVGLSCVKCCVVKVFQLLSLPFGVTQLKQYSYRKKKSLTSFCIQKATNATVKSLLRC